MKIVNKTITSLKNLKIMEILLTVLIVIYLLSNVSTPYNMAPYVNNLFMYASLLAFTVILFIYSNPLLAILFLVFSFVFVNRSKKVDHLIMKSSENNKDMKLKDLNSNLKATSLEEEIISESKDKPDNIPGPSTYQPVLCDDHSASSL